MTTPKELSFFFIAKRWEVNKLRREPCAHPVTTTVIKVETVQIGGRNELDRSTPAWRP
jgi:hypothetical protein